MERDELNTLAARFKRVMSEKDMSPIGCYPEDGQIYHLELQSAGDPAMPWRMLECYSLIGQLYQAPVRQQVLYLLALLCRGDDETEAVRAVLSKIAALDHNQRTDALERLQILSGLRPLKGVLQRAVKRMPVTLNLRENPFFQEAFAEGEQKGRAEDLQQGQVEGEFRLLSKQLQRRFGPLPEAVVARLRAADATTLERWGMRLLTAQSLDEVLADE